ncbi:MAG: 6-O-methylguanine DNA methyltransferase [Alphaproteobacteria bacterium CG_4_10_14_0_8_um_filter_53_9]|nr:MAG: 6-O-methylguanine DNA methyltransferase [Alphaproteobacteria bacterium CG_4_10_14_0_8_um_filter_53_9]
MENQKDLIKLARSLQGTPFQKAVWEELAKIPRGETRTYAQIAQAVGSHPRPVANACGKNPAAPTIPCHRVTGSNGTLGGYSGSGGLATKKRLLKEEGVILEKE